MHNILVSAYGCEPFVGSEAGVGWNWVLQMSENNHLHVITRKNNKEKIEANLPEELKSKVDFYYYDTPEFIKKFKRREKGLYLYYAFWQIGIVSIIKEIIKNNKIDYTMHLTFGSFWMPTFLPSFDIPFIWGPLGGGDCVPKKFLKVLPLKQRIVQGFRYFLKGLSFLNPLIVYPSKKAKVILARTEDSAQTVPKKYRNKVKVILETAMSEDIFNIIPKARGNDKLELIYAGRLVPTKNVMSLVETMRNIPPKYDIHLTIVGRGCEKKKLLDFVKKYQLDERVTFIDEIPRQQVLELLASSDVYLFPSLHEGGSWALMEAMALGLPVICLDCTGMHTITSDESAIRIPAKTPEYFVETMSKEICRLADDIEYRKEIGMNARERIWNNFRWCDKKMFMENLMMELDKESLG